jgi:hypothetical protein
MMLNKMEDDYDHPWICKEAVVAYFNVALLIRYSRRRVG